MQNLAKLISVDETKKIFVLSAMSSTTNAFVKISDISMPEKTKK
jgi:aspartokinase